MTLNWIMTETCPLCGSTNINLSYSKIIPAPPQLYPDMPKYEPRGLNLFYFNCADCDVYFMNPRHDEASLAHLYSSGLYREIMAHSLEEMDAGELERAERLIEFVPPGISLLDVGCGRGHLLKLARDKGCDVLGVEMDRGYPMDGIPFVEDILQTPDKFDMVACVHTLEHVFDPLELANHLKWLIKPGGRLLIEVPKEEAHGASAGIVHPFYFSPEVLMELFKEFKLILRVSDPHEMMIFANNILGGIND